MSETEISGENPAPQGSTSIKRPSFQGFTYIHPPCKLLNIINAYAYKSRFISFCRQVQMSDVIQDDQNSCLICDNATEMVT